MHLHIRTSLILPLLASFACNSDPYGATPEDGLLREIGGGWSTVRQATTLNNGDAADVFVPELSADERENAEDRFPVVVLLQGGLTPNVQYRAYASALASYGFVVIVPEHLRAFPPMFPEPIQLTEANVIPDALAAVAALDDDPKTPFYKVADPSRSALVGHSNGGIISLLAIAGQCVPGLCTPPFTLPPAVGAAALFGTNSVQGGMAIPVDTGGIPIALLQGSLDGRALPDDAALTYATLSPTRALITFAGLNHFAITDDNDIPGTIPDPNEQTLEQSRGTQTLALWTALWLHAALETSPVADHWLFSAAGDPEGTVSVMSELRP